MSYASRQIQIDFDIGEDQFASGTNKLSLVGLRSLVSINNSNGFSLGELSARIYGMRVEDMNKLSNMGKPFMAGRNYQVTVSAGDPVNGMTTIFTGTLYEAKIIYDQPNVSFDVRSTAGFLQKMQSAPPFSQQGSVSIADAITAMLPQGFTLVNNQNLTTPVSNPYYAQSSISQIKALCDDLGVNCDIRNNTVYIWPIGGSVDSDPIDIGPTNGLVGYPEYQSTGIIVRTSFNPNIVNGKTCNLTSDATGVTGQWQALVVNHNISAEYPGGPWFTESHMVPPGLYPSGV